MKTIKTLILLYEEDIEKVLESSLSIGTMREGITKLVKKAKLKSVRENNKLNKAIMEGRIC